MRHASKLNRLFATLLTCAALGSAGSKPAAAGPHEHPKLDPLLNRISSASGKSPIIVRAVDGANPAAVRRLLRRLGGKPGRALPLIKGHAAELPNSVLAALADSPFIARVSLDRVVVGAMERTSAAVGASSVRDELGLNGSGVGVAIIDSGITSWHDDLADETGTAQRIDRFVDFVNGGATPYDDYGHGTHVAGIIGGNGFDSSGARTGIAPGARLVVLKVLDASGRGRISDVIAALDYVVANKDALNIRVANLSVSAGAYESYDSDPLTLAAQRAVSAGIVVVAAAGNSGRGPEGRIQYGGVAAPGNAPWVLTVGASSHNGTIDRMDDSVAAFSSRGPGAGGASAKPDLVAPGVGIESLSDPQSSAYTTRSQYLLNGTVQTSYLPYLSLSGTSMAAPVVSGAVALMLQANPALRPNQVKAILQYTAHVYEGHDTLTQGAGFLNARGAVDLARFFAAPPNEPFPSAPDWSRRIIWGNRLVHGGRLTADANAWSLTTMWGAPTTPAGDAVQWGVTCVTIGCDIDAALWPPWTMSDVSENVVWGLACGGTDCQAPWRADTVFGTAELDTVVWGMNEEDTVVWGMSCIDSSCEPVIWSGR
jgi:serine protease AprX